MSQKPWVPPELLAHLKARFAMPRAIEEMSERQIMIARGRDQVLEYLEMLDKKAQAEATNEKG